MGTTTKEIGSSSFNDMISSVDRRSEYVENRAGANVRLNNFLTPYTLDNKSSILNAPCGYSNGVYASLRPSDARGPELVTNGTFDTDSDWVKTNATISGGKANFNIVAGAYAKVTQPESYISGKTYVLTAIVNGTAGKKMRFRDNTSNNGGLTSTNGQITMVGTNQSVELEFTATSNSSEIAIERQDNNSGDNYSFTVDNVSVKENTSADFVFERGSAATRVTKDGLIKDVQILGGDLVQNGNFEEIGSEEVSNGDFSQEGSELITNGGFDTDSDWTKGIGWTISGGKASRTAQASSSVLTANNTTLTVGKTYKCVMTISDYSSGSARFETGSTGFTLYSENGTFVEYIVATGTTFSVKGNSDFTGSIDNVSVVEVGQDWIFPDGWEIGDNKASFDFNIAGASNLRQNDVLTVGKIYKLTFDTLDSNEGNLGYYLGGNATFINNIEANTTHTVYGEAVGTYLSLRGSSNFIGSVTNISVEEVGQNWTFGTGWSMGDGKAVFDGFSNVSLQQDGIVANNKKYRLTYTILDYVQGGLKWRFGLSTNLTPVRNANGTYVEEIISTGSDFRAITDGATELSIDNVSVIEITDDTNLPRIDYTNGTGALLLEPQSTNTATYSNDFTQGDLFNGSSDPSLASSVLTSEQGIAPDGTNTAQKLTDNNDGGTGNIGFSYFSVNLTSGQQSTVSIFVKKDTLRYFVISFANYDTSEEISFDLDTNTINRGSGVITEYGNGWYRCSATFSTTTDTVGAIGFYGTDLANVIGGNLRDGTKSVLVWGLQCEELPYASSYIPTNGSTVTRNKDQASRSGLQDHINSTEGVLYAEIAALDDDGTSRRISLSNGTSSNRILLYFNPSNKIQALNVTGGSVQGNMTHTLDIKQFNKIAFKYKENDFALFVNGVKVNTDTSGLTYSSGTLNRLGFDNAVNGEPLFSRTRSIAVFNEALTDEELAKITSTTQQEVFYEMRDKMQQINADYYEFGDYTTRLKKLF